MITLEQAKQKATRLSRDVNRCTEYDDAFVFSNEETSFGGNEPVVILKKDGQVVGMTVYLDMKESTVYFIKEVDFLESL